MTYKQYHRYVRALVRDALLAAILIVSKEMLAFLPNVELVSMLIAAYTVAYGLRALVPVYIFVAVEAVVYPYFSTVVMYTYVWAILLLAVRFLLGRRVRSPLAYAVVCGLFGLLFGALCAPAQAIMFSLDLHGMLAWIAAGFPFDITHGIANTATAFLVPPLARLLLRLEEQSR